MLSAYATKDTQSSCVALRRRLLTVDLRFLDGRLSGTQHTTVILVRCDLQTLSHIMVKAQVNMPPCTGLAA